MLTDLRSIRKWAGYLQKTEIKFDMVSAVDELAKQVVYQHLAILSVAECGLVVQATDLHPRQKPLSVSCTCWGKPAASEVAALTPDLPLRWSWSLTSEGRQGSWTESLRT